MTLGKIPERRLFHNILKHPLTHLLQNTVNVFRNYAQT